MSEKDKDLTLENARKWDALARCHGYNELAKKATTLGEKTFCRLARDHAEQEYAKLGGRIEINEDQTPVVILDEHIPHVRFYPRDIEMMREALRAYDAGEPPK
jgi:hypothetical protein